MKVLNNRLNKKRDRSMYDKPEFEYKNSLLKSIANRLIPPKMPQFRDFPKVKCIRVASVGLIAESPEFAMAS